ncbi:MAG: hypothetical protein ACT4NX_02180 [Deltaproteobacteria bacterium]
MRTSFLLALLGVEITAGVIFEAGSLSLIYRSVSWEAASDGH